MGFRVSSLGSRVWGSTRTSLLPPQLRSPAPGPGVWGSGFEVQDLGFRVRGSGFGVQGLGSGICSLGFGDLIPASIPED